LSNYHIHIKGIVQGVGFRPYVFKLAAQNKLSGWVNNTTDGVHIELSTSFKNAKKFLKSLLDEPPPLSTITSYSLEKVKGEKYTTFSIIRSLSNSENNVILTPDFALCPECKSEIHNSEDRRFEYPFTTCVHCGPRFSIINSLPYDRDTTTMDAFKMCANCESEYYNPLHRRYYSQTNSCPQCSIALELFNVKGKKISTENTLLKVLDFWMKGYIVAIKGIGGYLLTCDATNQKVIGKLKSRKNRPDKPLAVMFPNLDILQKYLKVEEEEITELLSSSSPIVILPKINIGRSELPFEQIAPHISSIGAMLPYTPLYELLLTKFGKPIIATSGNISGSPILFKDEQANYELAEIADYILWNDREIVVPQDDSVVRYSPIYRRRIVIRRSRGLSPAVIQEHLPVPEQTILSVGADLKSTFSLSCYGNMYTSQFLGNLDNPISQDGFQHVLDHFLQLFELKPKAILADKHPIYFTNNFAADYAAKNHTPVLYYQHHTAHFAAVLGENNLLNKNEEVMGVIWDGTGYGDDKNIWGGEFFAYKKGEISRIAHYNYFPHILGDKMSKEPRISALSLLFKMETAISILRAKFSKQEWDIYKKILSKQSLLQTSSIGRLFDAIASLLGLIDIASFEGQAGMWLEELAHKWMKENNDKILPTYFDDRKDEVISLNYSNIIKDIHSNIPKGKIAACFHRSLVALIKRQAILANMKSIAFSGGVFQNALLVDFIIEDLGKDFKLYFHKQLSPNDENISFGQIMQYTLQHDQD
jgi:hydrogenase maturation protein HypF